MLFADDAIQIQQALEVMPWWGTLLLGFLGSSPAFIAAIVAGILQLRRGWKIEAKLDENTVETKGAKKSANVAAVAAAESVVASQDTKQAINGRLDQLLLAERERGYNAGFADGVEKGLRKTDPPK